MSTPGRLYPPTVARLVACAIVLFTQSIIAANALHAANVPTPTGLFGLGTIGATSTSNAISANGEVIVGYASGFPGYSRGGGFRWTAETGVIPIGALPENFFASEALGVSADGNVVVGNASRQGGPAWAYRWTPSGATLLGVVSGTESIRAAGVSGDGLTTVGGAFSVWQNIHLAIRWNSAGQPMSLGDVPNGIRLRWANSASFDASVIVGAVVTSAAPGGVLEPFRWTQATGMVSLANQLGGSTGGDAIAVSGDGSTVVGYRVLSGTYDAYLWRESTGMTSLGSGRALAVSHDGSIVVGTTSSGSGFIWDESHGTLDLKQYLELHLGIDLGNWMLTQATGISADGTRITGWGINPAGVQEAWLAVIPEPSVSAILFVGMLLRKPARTATRRRWLTRSHTHVTSASVP